MWFLLFFIVIPFIFFIGFYLFSVIIIFITNKIFHKQYSQSLSLILPCLSLFFYLMLIMGGISFKGIDPQYYEFKKLCEKAENVIYDEELYRIYNKRRNMEKYYDEKTKKEYLMSDFEIEETYSNNITKRLKETEATLYYNNKPFFKEKYYWFKYYGLFLSGDEGAGWHLKIEQRLLCENNQIIKR
ncbi:hypothetical protein [Helicobacter sp. MIT 14-3879]|uniref:hypothetical protein n=1 Tax=Helicobacter sp. MIT 14-3879 TaxID=2040649 RepID=UPI000E1FB399|nr:hypothetical protein [Helicobacter sp. MIT 14-3879]RDU59103.1 hypothetical protein CQA44_11715 [Helicobacter sp. MIT 14-3879]